MPPGSRGRVGPPAHMAGKWSSKPAGHQAARLRNNQRRHRERARAHTADLEARLADTQRRLDEAQAQIRVLSDALAVGTRRSCSTQPSGPDASNRASSASQRSSRASPVVHEPTRAQDERHRRPPVPPAGPEKLQQLSPLSARPASRMLPIPRTHRPRSRANASARTAVLPAPGHDHGGADEVAEGDCGELPAVQSGQSTVRCQDAYSIIAQQNYKGLDVCAIRKWLEPGFRGAIAQGEGCRVETHLLFALLDFITSA